MRSSALPARGGEIRLAKAYDRFDDNARNDWLEQLQLKIRQGLNPPDSPGPSRSPSPFETLEERKEREEQERRALEVDEGEDERHADEIEQDELFRDDDEEGMGVNQEVNGHPNGAQTLADPLAPYQPLASGSELQFAQINSFPPNLAVDGPSFSRYAQQTLPEESFDDNVAGPSRSYNPAPNMFAEEFIDPDLLTNLAQQLDSGIPNQQSYEGQDQFLQQGNMGEYMVEQGGEGMYEDDGQGQSGEYYQDQYDQVDYAEGYQGDQAYDQPEGQYIEQGVIPGDEYEQPVGSPEWADGEFIEEEYEGEERVEEDELLESGDEDVSDDREGSNGASEQYDEDAPPRKRAKLRSSEEGDVDNRQYDSEAESEFEPQEGTYIDDEAEEEEGDEIDEEDEEEEKEMEQEEPKLSQFKKGPQLMKRSSKPEVSEIIDVASGSENESEEEEEDEDRPSGEEGTSEEEEEVERDDQPRAKPTKRSRSIESGSSQSSQGDSRTPTPAGSDAGSPARVLLDEGGPAIDDDLSDVSDSSDMPLAHEVQATQKGEDVDELRSRTPTPPPASQRRSSLGTSQEPYEIESSSDGDEKDIIAPGSQAVIEEEDEIMDQQGVLEDEEGSGDQLDSDSEEDELLPEPAAVVAVQDGPRHLRFANDEEQQGIEEGGDGQESQAEPQHVHFDDGEEQEKIEADGDGQERHDQPRHHHFVDNEEEEPMESELLETEERSQVPGPASVEESSAKDILEEYPTAETSESLSTDTALPSTVGAVSPPSLDSAEQATSVASPLPSISQESHASHEHKSPAVNSLLSIPTAEEEEEQLEEMTSDVIEERHQPILMDQDEVLVMAESTSKDASAAMESGTGDEPIEASTSHPLAPLSIPSADEEEQMLEDMTVQEDQGRHQAIMDVDDSLPEQEEAQAPADLDFHHHRHRATPAVPTSIPSADEEDQLLDDMAGHGAEATHQPIMIDDEADIPLPAAPEGKEEEMEHTDYSVLESSNTQYIRSGSQPIEEREESIETPPTNMGFADYILQPPQHPDPVPNRSASGSPAPMTVEDDLPLPAEMSESRDYRDITPIPLPDPSAPAPDTDLPPPLEAGDMPHSNSRSPSMEAIAPAHTPPADMVVDTIQRPESPTQLPDPQLPPPDTDISAPILPQDLEPNDRTPTASVIAEAPEDTPTLPTDVSMSMAQTPRSREETPTDMPDPRLPPVDARLPMPDVPLQVENDHSVPASLIVHAPRIEEPIISTPNTASGSNIIRSPPALVVRDFGLMAPPPTFAQPSMGGSLGVDGMRDVPMITPNSEIEVEFVVPTALPDLPVAESMENDQVVGADPAAEVQDGQGDDSLSDLDTSDSDDEGAHPSEKIKDEDAEIGQTGEEQPLDDGEEGDVPEGIDTSDEGISPFQRDGGVDNEDSGVIMFDEESEEEDELQGEDDGPESGATEDFTEAGGPQIDEQDTTQPDDTYIEMEEPTVGTEAEVEIGDDENVEAGGSSNLEAPFEDIMDEQPARSPSPEHEPLRHHHRDSVTPTPEISASSQRIARRAQRYARQSLSATEVAVTRSHCNYRKLRIVEDDLAANVLVPQCVLGDTERMSREESVDLGVPTPQEEKEARTQRITHSNPILGAALAAKLHRVAGASIFDDGHCFLLSASPGARAEDEIRQKTPTTTTPRRISRGRQSAGNTTPSILLQIPESEHGDSLEDRKPIVEIEVGPSSMRRETSRNSQRSVSQISDLVAHPHPSPISAPRRSTRHTRSVSRLSQVSSEHDGPSTSGPTTRARSVQPMVAEGSNASIDTERSTTPVPNAREGSVGPRRSMRLSMSVGPEFGNEGRGDAEETISSQVPENQGNTPRTSKKHARTPSRGKGKGKAKVKEEENIEGEEETIPIHAPSPIQTPGKAISALQARRSLGYGKAQDDTLSYRPTTPEIDAEDTEDDDEAENSRTPKKAKVENDSPKVTGTRKRGSRLSIAGSVGVVDDDNEPSQRAQTRSGKRKAEAEAEGSQVKVDEVGEKKKEEKEKEAWEGVKKKQKKGWKRFIGL